MVGADSTRSRAVPGRARTSAEESVVDQDRDGRHVPVTSGCGAWTQVERGGSQGTGRGARGAGARVHGARHFVGGVLGGTHDCDCSIYGEMSTLMCMCGR